MAGYRVNEDCDYTQEYSDPKKAKGPSAPNALTGNMKESHGKPSVWRGVIKYFPRALMEVARVSDFGHSKYGEWGGWVNVDDAIDMYGDAKCRHMLKEAMQISTDDESELMHAAHEAWGALARLELLCRERKRYL